VLAAIAADANAFGSPARQALVPSLVPQERLTNTLSLSSTAFQVATVLGPSPAGLVIAGWGVAAVYLVDAVSFLAAPIALYLINPPPVEGALRGISVRAAIEGLRFVWHTPIIRFTMMLDFVATFFGSATAPLSIFAREILHVGSAGYGLLYAAPSVGAVLTGVVMSFYSASVRRKGVVILTAVGFYAAFTVLFGPSRAFPFPCWRWPEWAPPTRSA
jgi:predicted MFS family arabinose efflux permease